VPPVVKPICDLAVNTTTATDPVQEVIARRPKRADALRNYENLITAARDAFAEGGASTSLEEIARRAGVGIGTLYRHFPTRQELLEAVYVGELEAICRSADEHAGREPWDALVGWLHAFVDYLATKRALATELLNYMDPDADVFRSCRTELYTAGAALLERAQASGAVRSDTDIGEVIQMVGGIAKIPNAEPEQVDRILEMALDGLRYRPQPPSALPPG
jgi:AcrR family transcriptional regulator